MVSRRNFLSQGLCLSTLGVMSVPLIGCANAKPAPSGAARIAGHQRRVWRDASGVEQIEAHVITGLGHGLPITSIGPEACGTPGPYFLECGLSSTRRIAAFWGIAPKL